MASRPKVDMTCSWGNIMPISDGSLGPSTVMILPSCRRFDSADITAAVAIKGAPASPARKSRLCIDVSRTTLLVRTTPS